MVTFDRVEPWQDTKKDTRSPPDLLEARLLPRDMYITVTGPIGAYSTTLKLMLTVIFSVNCAIAVFFSRFSCIEYN